MGFGSRFGEGVEVEVCCIGGGSFYLRFIILRNCIFLRKFRSVNIKKMKGSSRYIEIGRRRLKIARGCLEVCFFYFVKGYRVN